MGLSASSQSPSSSPGGYQPFGGQQNGAGAYHPPSGPPPGAVQSGPIYKADGSNDPAYKQYLQAYNNPNGYGNPQGGPQLSYAQYQANAKHRNTAAAGGAGSGNHGHWHPMGGPSW